MSVRWRRRTGRVVRWAGNGSGKDDGEAAVRQWLRWKGVPVASGE